MREKQGIFNFEKQEAGRDIYNIAIQHLATGKKVNLPSIQYALRKGETNKGNFFKNEPEWVDFEQGYIVERKEVTEIINKLDTNKVQLVLGKPASGKSIILKNVGFKLADENKKIYIVELKKHQIEDVKLYFEAIPEINDDNPIFIVDDAHLYPSECEKLIRDFKSGGKGKLLIGSRPTEDILPKHPKKVSEFQILNKTKIQAEDVTEEMIRIFLIKKHDFGNERIETVSKNLKKYKNDLWELSWALKAYQPEKDSVDNEEIYEKIMLSITEIETKDRKTISGEDVFLPISIFYRYEIPVGRKFLEKQLGIEKNIINQLIGLQEIEETKETRMLSLNHSSIADLYFGAYKKYPYFGEEIKEKILNQKDEKDLEFCSFYRYLLTEDPRNAIDIVIHLGLTGKFMLFKKLIDENKIHKIIDNGIEKEEDIGKIGLCVSYIADINKDVALKLVNSIDIKSLSSKIDKEDNLHNISLLHSITWVSEKAGKELFNLIDVKALSTKIEHEVNLINVGSCVESIARANGEVGLRLFDSILLRIENEEDIENIGGCVALIGFGNKKLGLKLINSINIDALSSKIKKEEDIEVIGWSITDFAEVSEAVGLKLVDIFLSKIQQENNHMDEIWIWKIGYSISSIAEVSKNIANEIVTRLNPKLREELQKRMPKLKSQAL